MMRLFACSLFALLISDGVAQADEGLVLLPKQCKLDTPESSQRLLLQRTLGEDVNDQVTKSIEWTSSDPKVATVADGVVKPEGDGEAIVEARLGGKVAKAKVVVTGMARPIERSFRNDLEPIFAKMGCNSGACHGALAGKGGFRLSLNGYDPASDYFHIVKLERGRRVELSDPGRSLVLAKPTGAIAHKGGTRFPTDSREYRIFAARRLARRLDPPRRPDSADRGPGPLYRRRRRGRHPMGQVVIRR
jgi:hypothetical protein